MAERHINLCINVSLRRFVKLKVSEEEDGARVRQCCTTRWWTVHLHHPQRQLPFSCTSDLIKTHMILQFSSSCHVNFGRAWLLQWNCLQRKAQRLYFYCIYSAPVFLILHLCSLVRAVNNKNKIPHVSSELASKVGFVSRDREAAISRRVEIRNIFYWDIAPASCMFCSFCTVNHSKTWGDLSAIVKCLFKYPISF